MTDSITTTYKPKIVSSSLRAPEIHETSIVDPHAKVHHTAKIGPFCIVEKNVEIGAGCHLMSHVVIRGDTKIGKNNIFYQFSTIGEAPPDKKYAGENTKLIIGDNNVFREATTVHIGTIQDDGETVIGSGNLFMAYAHVAHDCHIGDNNVFANNATLAGHVKIGHNVNLGGFVKVAQHCQINNGAFVAGDTEISKDIPAFIKVAANPARPLGLNTVGLGRMGATPKAQAGLKQAYRITYQKQLNLKDALLQLHDLNPDEEGYLGSFISSIETSMRGILR